MTDLPLPPLSDATAFDLSSSGRPDLPLTAKGASDLEQVFDVPVIVSAVLGTSHMSIGELLQLAPGRILQLERKVGEPIDIFVNNRLVARGEVVLVEDRLGVTMTEIVRRDA